MKFIEDIQSVFDRDPAARNTFEVITCYSGVQAMLFYRLTHRLWLLKLKWLARFISMLARWITGVEIHPGAVIGRRFFIDHGMGVVIGETAQIGDDCTLYHGVTLGGTTWKKGKRHPTLGNNVVIGAGAKILGPIILGDDVRVGSNSVVVKSVDNAQTVVGVPARVLKDSKTQTDHFESYAVGTDVDDPTVKAINSILSHIHDMDEQLNIVSKKLDIKDQDDIDVDKLEIESK
ncbi:MAG TPA: serine O-acetyltransferase [Gammaproteobacteria bacterium]|jgi:serine O-acetyltransferase|nr:serine O-acetyltransferase [Gammaproteobacteria bacterium]HAP05701.1 serine O-acetyltransferase [Gammaproteobacteria bacterium]HBG03891.1 serine O-acetyltransferase [Gammaproteobacteria bacterium]HCE35187.1 serine O-acetyltransferase [Gammaproteobacteria bacterium]HCH57959.1 serine O-acetyltransferase [Gammaproteobacteria bacterium]